MPLTRVGFGCGDVSSEVSIGWVLGISLNELQDRCKDSKIHQHADGS
jgi:hypothetical protein